jgi:hypothetical protein
MSGPGARSAVAAVAVVAMAAAVAAGCGGGSSSSWKPLPKAPIAGRIGEGVVWTGKEMIVWGGVTRTGAVRPASDGAAYDPATRAWRTIAPAPRGVLGVVGNGAAWTGRTAVFWAGNSPDGPAAGAVYDPAADTWRRLPSGPLGPREGYASVWTGKELLIISGTSGDGLASPAAAAVNPASGAWRLLPALNAVTGLLANGAVWDGQEAFVIGKQSLCPQLGSSCQKFRPVFLAYHPATDSIRQINTRSAPVDAQQVEQLTPIAWTGTEVVFSTAGDPSAALVGYDPGSDSWNVGKSAPCTVAAGYAQTAWLGDRYVVPCGSNGLQTYQVATNAWQKSKPGPSPLNSREGSAIVWTGTDLIAWSGTVRAPLNPTPADGASLTP